MEMRAKSFSAIDKDKIVSPKGEVKREKPLCELSREEVYSQKHLTWGKLSFADKLAFGAAALALENAAIQNPQNCGIVLLTNIGSFSRDAEFMQSVRQKSPSPQLFSATLPSSPIAEISITFGLKGPNKVIFSDEEFAMQCVEFMLKDCGEVLFTEINIPVIADVADTENSFARTKFYSLS